MQTLWQKIKSKISIIVVLIALATIFPRSKYYYNKLYKVQRGITIAEVYNYNLLTCDYIYKVDKTYYYNYALINKGNNGSARKFAVVYNKKEPKIHAVYFSRQYGNGFEVGELLDENAVAGISSDLLWFVLNGSVSEENSSELNIYLNKRGNNN